MKTKRKYLLILAFIVITVTLYFNTNFYIRSVSWKYNNGFHVGDWIEFNNKNLSYRTISDGQKPIAKVVFCYGKGLIIKDIATGEMGYYSNKG